MFAIIKIKNLKFKKNCQANPTKTNPTKLKNFRGRKMDDENLKFEEKLIKRAKEKNSRLIFNFDKIQALETLNEISDLIAAVKINRTLTDTEGLHIAQKVKKFNIPVIADFKISDIPNTNETLAKNAKNAGFDAVTVHAFPGTDSVKAVSCIMDVILVVSMSHEGAKQFMTKNIENFCEVAKELEINSIVAPATRVEEIKAIRKILKSALILSPGVGAQGASAGDAVKAGADFEMVGRSLYVDNPRKKAEEMQSKLKFF